jgi:hypothetical protein
LHHNAYHFILQIGEENIRAFLNFHNFVGVKFALRLHEEERTKIQRLTCTVIIMKTTIFRLCRIYRKFIETIIEEDKHCTYDVILRRVRATIVAVEQQYHIFRECVCSLSYPACNARAQRCHLWSFSLYNIFPHYLINGATFEKKIESIKRVF